MTQHTFRFIVEGEDQASASRAAAGLADTIREAEGVRSAVRGGADPATMDLGVIVTAIASSGATLALAQGVAAWLRARKGARLTIERDGQTGSIKAAVAGVDSETAVRIVEIVRG